MNNFKISLALCAAACAVGVAGCGSKTSDTPTTPQAVETTAPADFATPIPGTSTKPTPATKPMADAKPMPAATMMNAKDMKLDTKTYRVRGVVKSVEKSVADGRMTLNVNHETIPGFMQAMEMRVPFAKNDDANKVKVGDKIAFDMNHSTLDVSNIEKLPPSTQLKLK